LARETLEEGTCKARAFLSCSTGEIIQILFYHKDIPEISFQQGMLHRIDDDPFRHDGDFHKPPETSTKEAPGDIQSLDPFDPSPAELPLVFLLIFTGQKQQLAPWPLLLNYSDLHSGIPVHVMRHLQRLEYLIGRYAVSAF